MAPYLVLYDDQCEICQAGVSWLHLLDSHGKVSCVPVGAAGAPALPSEETLRELHVVSPSGEVVRGWAAVARLASLFPSTWVVGFLGRIPPFSWLGRVAYRFVALNRYALSKCRGGACRAVRRQSSLSAFWSCYAVGCFVRAPLMVVAAVRQCRLRIAGFLGSYRRRLVLLDGRLQIFYLGGFPVDVIPILFGEKFAMPWYRGIAVDPGSPKMRGSLERHLGRADAPPINAVVATHQHEEHVGNLRWLADRAKAPLWLSARTLAAIRRPAKLPAVRSVMIGQPGPLDPPYELLGDRLRVDGVELQVFPAPGHCDDHVVLYAPEDKLLLAGDAFMGTYFATPNPDVDSLSWVETLRRLVELDVEILVDGHGHVYTKRADVPDLPGVVIRQDPREELREKLRVLEWMHAQIVAGLKEGLPIKAIEATCFPWGQRWAWESYLSDSAVTCLSLGHFSRSEQIRSFLRASESRKVLPSALELKVFR